MDTIFMNSENSQTSKPGKALKEYIDNPSIRIYISKI